MVSDGADMDESGIRPLVGWLRRYAMAIALAAVVMAGTWMRWPALFAGFHTDDSVQIAMLRGDFPAKRHFWDLFRFADVARDGRALVDFGYLPWWTEHNLRLAMFRPLSSALIAFDYAAFGTNAVLYHAHSLLWWALLMGAAALLLHKVLPLVPAAIALVLFAVDESHSSPVIWLANRNTLVSATFGILGLFVHLRQRERRSRRGAMAEATLFTLALLGGEYALSIFAYVIAFEVLAVKVPTKERILGLLPVVLPSAVYLVARAALAFGIRGSGFYIGFTESPGAFLRSVYERVPALWGDLVFAWPAADWAINPVLRRPQASAGIAGAIALLVLSRWPSSTSQDQIAPARWLAWGAIVAAFTGAGALPEDRLLVGSSLGAAAVFADFLRRFIDARKQLLHAALALPVAGAILYVHGFRAAENARDNAINFQRGARAQQLWALHADIPYAAEGTQRVVIVSAADFTTGANLPWIRKINGYPLPLSYWRLSGSSHVHEMYRLAPNVLDLAVLSDDLGWTMAGSLYRPEDDPIRVGQVFHVNGLRVEILATAGVNPWRTRFTFDRPLDDSSVVFLHSTPDGLRQFKPPAVGDRLRLPSPEMPRL